MTKPKHSEGPWEKKISYGQINIITSDGYEVASIPDPDEDGGRGEEDHQNANLLAACPDMLKALKKLLHEFEAQGSEMRRVHGKLFAQCTKAIAKAEGDKDEKTNDS